MARSKVSNTEPQVAPDIRPVRRLLSGTVVQVVVFVNGLILTIAASVILHMFIQGMIQNDIKRVVWDSQERVQGSLTELQSILRSAATIIVTSRAMGEDAIRKNVLYGVTDIGKFERFFWISRNPAASPDQPAWLMHDIATQKLTDEAAMATVITDDELLKFVTALTSKSADGLVLSSDIPATQYVQEYVRPVIKARPFLMKQTLMAGTPNEIIIVGVSRPSRIIEKEWIDNKDGLNRLALRDVEYGHSIFFLDRVGTQSEESLTVDNSQNFEINIGGEKWRMLIDAGVNEASRFLLHAPMMLLVFGLALTVVGSLYVRNNQKQSVRLSAMNRTLAQKNYELNSEVTQREKLNATVRKAEREYRAIIDSVSDIIFETSTDGEILFLNGTWRKVTGFEIDQAIARNIFELLHPQDQDEQRTNFEQLVKGQRNAYRMLTRLRTMEGSFRTVELAMSMIRMDDNKNLRVVGTMTDVEERRRAERALTEAEKKYRTIVENAAGGIYQIAASGQILSANPAMARIFEYDTVEGFMREVQNAHALYVMQRERARLIRELEVVGVAKNFELEVKTRSGQKVWISENARAVRNDEGSILYFEGSVENITQRKLAEMSLREAKVRSDLASRAKSEFLANMSHELRTPLNAIIGFSEIIKDEVLGKMENRQYWEYARDIYDSGRNLLNIINEILDVSRIEAGERQLNEGIINTDHVIMSCLSFVQPKADAANLTITNLTEGGVPNLIAEELAIKQILLNVLSNAIKFTPEGGRITIAHEVDSEGQMRISITDTGIGLDENEIEKAISPFGQIETSLSRAGSGAGLGLTLVDSLMKLHGGKLELFSQKGIGTTVTLLFPSRRVTQERGTRRWQG